MRSLTLVLAYYENPFMLGRQMAALSMMEPSTKKGLRLIVVDDGSPKAPARAMETGVPIEIYRMGLDVRWNQDACRNLGVDRARDGWILMTDIDHLVPEETIKRLLETDLDPDKVYKFSRISEPDMAPYKPHPNSWLMTKAMFDRIGGYDERFAGYYGTDGDFRDSVSRVAETVVLPLTLVRVPREVTPDASTTTYLRKQPEDAINIPRIKHERGQNPNWRPLRGLFPWTRIA